MKDTQPCFRYANMKPSYTDKREGNSPFTYISYYTAIVDMSRENFVFNIRDYKVHSVIGQGAYGVVAVGQRLGSEKVVAIKKIEPFERELFCLRTLREVKFLKHFNHPNIIRILDIQKPLSFEGFSEVYLIQEYMDADLHSVIRTHELSDKHMTYMIYQLLKGVKYLHSCGIIHRDLKPANLLVNEKCDLKICDFGLARLENDTRKETQLFLTEYVATRWYRAPEIMLSLSQYTKAIDIWSIGCILAEMMLREPLFPGKDYRHQLLLIFEVLGTPSDEDLDCIKLQRAREYIETRTQKQRKIPMKKIFRNASTEAVDFIEKTLTFNPDKRFSIDECLNHPYVYEFRDPISEITAEHIPQDFFFFDEYKDQLEMVDLKRMLYAEIITG